MQRKDPILAKITTKENLRKPCATVNPSSCSCVQVSWCTAHDRWSALEIHKTNSSQCNEIRDSLMHGYAFLEASSMAKMYWNKSKPRNLTSRYSAFARKDASRNSASFFSLLIISRSEHAAFRSSLPELELETCNSWSKFSNLIKASSTLSSDCNDWNQFQQHFTNWG